MEVELRGRGEGGDEWEGRGVHLRGQGSEREREREGWKGDMDGGQGAQSSAERTVQECQQTPPRRPRLHHPPQKKFKTNDQLDEKGETERTKAQTGRSWGWKKKKGAFPVFLRALCVTGLHCHSTSPFPLPQDPPPLTPPPPNTQCDTLAPQPA